MPTNGFIKTTQIGYLAADPSFKKNPDGSMVANFRVLTTTAYKTKADEKKEETNGVRYELWGKSAENFVSFMKSGHRVHIESTLHNDTYEKNGVPTYQDRHRVTSWLSLTAKADGEVVGGEGDAEPSGSNPIENP